MKLSLISRVVFSQARSMPWKGTMAPKVALRHMYVAGTGTVNGNHDTGTTATNVPWLMEYAACSEQLALSVSK